MLLRIPAGMAAGVYGSSEGLRVLIVGRCAAGGQAGTSSGIENYWGFPEGIPGEDPTGRGCVKETLELMYSIDQGDFA
jgi:thioredoxin reductase (NADPH)